MLQVGGDLTPGPLKQAGRWIIDTASLAIRIAIGAIRTREAKVMTEPAAQYPWDDDHAEAANFRKFIQAGISPAQIEAALGSDARGMGRYRRFNGRSRRWIDSRLIDIEVAAEREAEQARAARNLATERQIRYILDLLARRRRDGEGGGFFTGLTDYAGIAKLSRSEASAYIDSLKGQF
ncbi:hypothetical protein [Streptomyces aureocirculatus]|uniref:hypothetical protein n=1 Tax=Streptomyces aureocirculatus TaxID=67275 RepID=UPI0004C7FDF6|nr:hypothetical protein [Streptomyces aureocirculatus]